MFMKVDRRIAIAIRFCNLTKVMVHKDGFTYGKDILIAIVGRNCDFSGQKERSSASMDKVRPLPSLRSKEKDATNDGRQHPTHHTSFVVSVTRFHSKYHRHRRDDQDKCH